MTNNTTKIPEPVATVRRTPSAITYKHKTSLGLNLGENYLITTEQAEAYAQAVRDEALEQAAKGAESMHHDSAPYWVAARIRSLKKEQS